MKIAATIQARMGSTRLPGKVLKPILGKPMLALQIERIQQCRLIDEIIIATTVAPQDEAIVTLARELGVNYFRGSEDDVIGRVVGALKAFAVDLHVEFMGDNPIPDPLLVDAIIGYYLKNADRYDYVTNALKTTYAPGFEVFVYPAAVLYDAESRITEPKLREHVGIHINRYPDRYRLCNLEAPPWYYYPNLHLEVDTPEDFAVITAIFEHFYLNNPGFTMSQVIDFMKANPDLLAANAQVERRWKAFRQD
ncbi:MAG: cytidylyltransferase domain-containing protein [Thermodesulfobacteriota bacterium]